LRNGAAQTTVPFDPYYGGEKGFILYTDEIEPDHKYHLPADDDDEVHKAKSSDHFQRKTIGSTICGIFLITGLFCVFIILPALSFSTDAFLPVAS
jgi:beta-glucan synthesis-associated protein KRE6